MCPNCEHSHLNLLDNAGNWTCPRCGSQFTEKELEDFFDLRGAEDFEETPKELIGAYRDGLEFDNGDWFSIHTMELV